MQALVDRNSEATDTGGFVSLSTVANRVSHMHIFITETSNREDIAVTSAESL